MDADLVMAFLSDTRETVAALWSEADDDPDVTELANIVVAARARMGRDARPLTDLHLADTLATATLDLLSRATTQRERRLASVAARYFAGNPDADLSSPYGFDDDVEVFNAIALRIAPELVLTV